MKVNIGGTVQDYHTIWRKDQKIFLIDQRKLPHAFTIITLEKYEETADAIKNMTLRGAGAIGVAGGYGMAQAAMQAKRFDPIEFENYILDAADCLKKTRPTAANLFHAVNRCLNAGSRGPVSKRVEAIVSEADKIAKEDLSASERIGRYGCDLIKDGHKILTHCNAGALAFIDHGTALSPIRFAHKQGKKLFVFVDETRPRCQGSRLTAWELGQENIPYAIIVDNAAGYYMRTGEIDMVIVGADRIAVNGDVANKIGTYEKAVIAKENGIPFYVAAPKMTFDLSCGNGDEIIIEERDAEEVIKMWGIDENGDPTKILIAEKDAHARNPAFDVTPAKYISGFITELGVIRPPYERNIPETIKQ